VLGNEYFDRTERKKIPLIPDPIFNKDEIVKTPTIYDAAKQAGLTTAGGDLAGLSRREDAGLDGAGCV
jgi:hypothetical protein